MIITDNFLERADFEKIKKFITGDYFPWYVNPFILYSGESFDNVDHKDYHFQFTHKFYNNYIPQSDFLDLLEPIINKLNASAILRIKANCNTITHKHMFHECMHNDIPNFTGKTAIYYINTNNGYTLFNNGEKVDAVENRLVVFDSDRMHTGISSTDTSFRYVINFNYYEWNR